MINLNLTNYIQVMVSSITTSVIAIRCLTSWHNRAVSSNSRLHAVQSE